MIVAIVIAAILIGLFVGVIGWVYLLDRADRRRDVHRSRLAYRVGLQPGATPNRRRVK